MPSAARRGKSKTLCVCEMPDTVRERAPGEGEEMERGEDKERGERKRGEREIGKGE